MDQEESLRIRIGRGLKDQAQAKAKRLFDIGLGTLVKLFLRSFVEQKNIGFYVGDEDFNDRLNHLLKIHRFKKVYKEGLRANVSE